MKAWMFNTNDDDGHGCIVFASDEAEAMQKGIDQIDGDEDYSDVERKPQYDQYADQGAVPKKVLLEDGWWFECWECSTMISEDIDDYEDVVYSGDAIYCCQQCKDDRDARISRINQEAWDFYVSLVNGWCKWDVISHPHGYPSYSPECRIDFPGRNHTASVAIRGQGKNCGMVLFVSGEDREAYQAWEEAG